MFFIFGDLTNIMVKKSILFNNLDDDSRPFLARAELDIYGSYIVDILCSHKIVPDEGLYPKEIYEILTTKLNPQFMVDKNKISPKMIQQFCDKMYNSKYVDNEHYGESDSEYYDISEQMCYTLDEDGKKRYRLYKVKSYFGGFYAAGFYE